MKRFALAVAVVAGLAVLALAVRYVPNVFARDNDNSEHDRESVKVFDRESVIYGRTYSEWNAAWEQWADSIPAANHPLFDNGDCSVGQSGPVWFLGRKFFAAGSTADSGNVFRYCNVPEGKALYVAIYNAEDSAIEQAYSFPGQIQIGTLRTVTETAMDGITELGMQVDGENIQNIKGRFRVQSPNYAFTLPDDNLFKAIGETAMGTGKPISGGFYGLAVDDGYYVMVAPLSIGNHTIHFHGAAGVDVLDMTYHIHVYH